VGYSQYGLLFVSLSFPCPTDLSSFIAALPPDIFAFGTHAAERIIEDCFSSELQRQKKGFTYHRYCGLSFTNPSVPIHSQCARPTLLYLYLNPRRGSFTQSEWLNVGLPVLISSRSAAVCQGTTHQHQ
jgi:hypothetical protein